MQASISFTSDQHGQILDFLKGCPLPPVDQAGDTVPESPTEHEDDDSASTISSSDSSFDSDDDDDDDSFFFSSDYDSEDDEETDGDDTDDEAGDVENSASMVRRSSTLSTKSCLSSTSLRSGCSEKAKRGVRFDDDNAPEQHEAPTDVDEIEAARYWYSEREIQCMQAYSNLLSNYLMNGVFPEGLEEYDSVRGLENTTKYGKAQYKAALHRTMKAVFMEQQRQVVQHQKQVSMSSTETTEASSSSSPPPPESSSTTETTTLTVQWDFDSMSRAYVDLTLRSREEATERAWIDELDVMEMEEKARQSRRRKRNDYHHTGAPCFANALPSQYGMEDEHCDGSDNSNNDCWSHKSGAGVNPYDTDGGSCGTAGTAGTRKQQQRNGGGGGVLGRSNHSRRRGDHSGDEDHKGDGKKRGLRGLLRWKRRA